MKFVFTEFTTLNHEILLKFFHGTIEKVKQLSAEVNKRAGWALHCNALGAERTNTKYKTDLKFYVSKALISFVEFLNQYVPHYIVATGSCNTYTEQ